MTDVSKYSNSEVITPMSIVEDMVDLLPADVFRLESKFLDIACKSGRFLASIYNRLITSDAMIQAFPDMQDRHNHIVNNQLYGIATSSLAATIARKQIYNNPIHVGNIVYQPGKFTSESVQGVFENMKFDVVIGNPPYNNDIYLDFVELGHKLADKCSCWITPAKWQAKGGARMNHSERILSPT